MGQWSGVNLKQFLQRVGADLTAKYVSFKCADDYYGSIDMATALHPQTILATKYAKEPITDPIGFPLRLRTATKLGFKNPKWITAIEWKRERLILLDTSDFSHRRKLGSTIVAAWSPDSKYLLVWKDHFLKCGFSLDVEPPASLQVVDVASGKRSLVLSSQCQFIGGPIGWVASDIRK